MIQATTMLNTTKGINTQYERCKHKRRIIKLSSNFITFIDCKHIVFKISDMKHCYKNQLSNQLKKSR